MLVRPLSTFVLQFTCETHGKVTEKFMSKQKGPEQANFSASLEVLLKNLSETGRGSKQLMAVAADSGLAAVCLWAAYSLRHGQLFSDFKTTWHFFILLPAITVFIFAGLGVYRWVIRTANQRLFRQLFKGSCLSAIALLVLFFLLPAERPNPRSLFVIYGLLAFFSTSGIRLLWKTILDSENKGELLAIYGAGAGGQQLVNLLGSNDKFCPALFIDDDSSLTGKTLSGLPILDGNSDQLSVQLKRYEVSKVVLAMPAISNAAYHKKIRQLEKLDLPTLTMPSIEELITGAAKVDEIRDVSVNDILGRKEVVPNVELMGRRVTGKVVLVTGGGGSIGSEICRQVMRLKPARLIIVDNSEANLYHITEELNGLSSPSVDEAFVNFLPLLGSVTNRECMEKWMAEFRVNTVFHAAAYKHVPIVEAQPDQGVDVNIFGTLKVLESAIQQGVSDFVLISTDKAVRPTNSMGATKRVAELVLQAKSALGGDTRISMVRFGNVLGSSGSVVPKFKRQILENGPITLTHTDVTRYFMTIPEAAQLVLQASAIAKGGDVFVLDMGEPVKISDLARTMVHLYGKKLQEDTGNDSDIEIQVQGLRPGEKLYEELFISKGSEPTEVGKISTSREVWLDWEELSVTLDILQNNSDYVAIREQLMQLAFLGESDSDIEMPVTLGNVTSVA